jgi:hypothetical protein
VKNIIGSTQSLNWASFVPSQSFVANFLTFYIAFHLPCLLWTFTCCVEIRSFALSSHWAHSVVDFGDVVGFSCGSYLACRSIKNFSMSLRYHSAKYPTPTYSRALNFVTTSTATSVPCVFSTGIYRNHSTKAFQ